MLLSEPSMSIRLSKTHPLNAFSPIRNVLSDRSAARNPSHSSNAPSGLYLMEDGSEMLWRCLHFLNAPAPRRFRFLGRPTLSKLLQKNASFPMYSTLSGISK